MQPQPQPQPPPAPLPHNMRRCTACGKPIADNARTCPHCGKTYTTTSGVFIAILIGLIIGGAVFVLR